MKKVIIIFTFFILLFILLIIINNNIIIAKEDEKVTIKENNIYDIEKYSVVYKNIKIKLNNKKITAKQLNDFTTYRFTCAMQKMNDEVIVWDFAGVKLNDILDNYGFVKYSRLIVTGKDGYSATIDKSFITDNTYIAFYQDGERMNGEFTNKLVMPGYGPNYWIHNIERIEVE